MPKSRRSEWGRQRAKRKPELDPDLDTLGSKDWSLAFSVFSGMTAERPPVGAKLDLSIARGLTDALKSKARKAFLEWWLAYLEAMTSYEMFDGWITSPFHSADDDEVRRYTRDRIIALTKKAKEKLAKRLRDRAKELRERAKAQRAKGQVQQAERTERQAQEFDIAADEVEK